MAQTVKNPPATESQVQFLVWEGPLEKGMATHSSILAWRIPWTEEPGRLQPMGSQRVWHDWLSYHTHMHTHTHTHTWVEFLSFLHALFLLAALCSMWDLSSQTRDPACASFPRRQHLNSWTTGEVPWVQFLIQSPGYTVSMLYDMTRHHAPPINLQLCDNAHWLGIHTKSFSRSSDWVHQVSPGTMVWWWC